MSVLCRCCGSSVEAGLPCPVDGNITEDGGGAKHSEEPKHEGVIKRAIHKLEAAKDKWITSADELDAEPQPKPVETSLTPKYSKAPKK